MHPNPDKRYHDVRDLKMAISNRSNNRLYIIIIAFLTIMTAVLAWLIANPSAPTVANQ